MVLNPFFLQGSHGEQSLVQDIINEQLKIYGVEVHYMPRKYLTESSVIREVIQSSFDQAYPIEAYVNNFDGYGDNTTILSKFGIQQTQEISLIISKERFETYISTLMSLEENMKLTTRPKEGDLIYFPLGDRLFEIKFVEHEKPFYQLRKNYVYELTCELFRYEDEVIDTGNDEIDDVLIGGESDGLTDDNISTIIGPTQTLTMIGVGVTATAIAGNPQNGGVRSFAISNRGAGYLSIPSVTLSNVPSGGIIGIGSVTKMIGGINFCNLNANPGAQSVQQLDVVNPGRGYVEPPKVKFKKTSGRTGTGAAATSIIGDGVVGIITVTDGGGGYTVPPEITFSNENFLSGVTTVSAAATAIVSAAGTITEIRFMEAGAGYSAAPTITIGNPHIGSTGEFIFNETITGSTSGTTARVRIWTNSTNVLEVGNVDGTFIVGETIVGSVSSASHILRVIDKEPDNDPYADNFDIETEADKIIDFSERNPFGIP
tara:strand:- start:9646 stop:11106 length:1461 start_codon:yes stop_codon:yes gene_type:complete